MEAIRNPSAGAVFWTAATRDGTGGPRAITGPAPRIDVSLTAPLPSGLRVVTGSRGLVVLVAPVFYDHEPSEAELTSPPTLSPVTIQGMAVPRDGRFHPRLFKATLSPSTPTYVPLRASLQATRIGEAGAVILSLHWQDGSAASWSIARLACVRNSETLGFSAQADVNGDTIIPLTGLPPLPAGQSSDSMTLTVLGDASAAGAKIADPDKLLPVQVSIGAGFAAQEILTIVRGRITKGRDLNIPVISLKPT